MNLFKFCLNIRGLELKKNWIKNLNSIELFVKSSLLKGEKYRIIFNDVYNYGRNDYSKNNILIMYVIIRVDGLILHTSNNLISYAQIISKRMSLNGKKEILCEKCF